MVAFIIIVVLIALAIWYFSKKKKEQQEEARRRAEEEARRKAEEEEKKKTKVLAIVNEAKVELTKLFGARLGESFYQQIPDYSEGSQEERTKIVHLVDNIYAIAKEKMTTVIPELSVCLDNDAGKWFSCDESFAKALFVSYFSWDKSKTEERGQNWSFEVGMCKNTVMSAFEYAVLSSVFNEISQGDTVPEFNLAWALTINQMREEGKFASGIPEACESLISFFEQLILHCDNIIESMWFDVNEIMKQH